jgi:anti-sigma-K factor RskA
VKLARDEMHVLTGSYALEALAPQEREAFERHLQHCGSCAAEVRGLRETAARLAMAKARRPPARMRQRVLAAAYRTRQLPPVLTATRPDRARLAARPGTRPRTRARTRARTRPRTGLRIGAQVSQRVRRPVLALAAAGLAAALALSVTQLTSQHRPDVSVQTVRTSAGGAVTLVTSPSQQDAVLTATRLPSLTDGRVYQVWVIGPAGARAAGFLSGAALALTGLRAGERVGVTEEPAGGTSRPTTSPIVLVPVPA